MAGGYPFLGRRAVVQRKGGGRGDEWQPGQSRKQKALLGSHWQSEPWRLGDFHFSIKEQSGPGDAESQDPWLQVGGRRTGPFICWVTGNCTCKLEDNFPIAAKPFKNVHLLTWQNHFLEFIRRSKKGNCTAGICEPGWGTKTWHLYFQERLDEI